MCNFFSLLSDGKGNCLYFDRDIRAKILRGDCVDKQGNKISKTDSHSSIAAYHGIFGEQEDLYNKYEYNPLTQNLVKDKINTTDDSGKVLEFCKALDFKEIVPELNLKPIVHPFKDFATTKVTESDIELLKQWASVWASVGASVGASVWDSVGASVWDSVGDSVGASVGDSVGASVGASVWASVGDSVGDSVWDSVGAYTGSYFELEKWKYIEHNSGEYPYQPLVDLWERGLVPSYDGKVWRLHGKGGKIIWEGTV